MKEEICEREVACVQKAPPQGIGGWLRRVGRGLKRSYQLHLIALVPMIMIIVFAYVPMGGIILAWKKYIATKGIYGSPWVGWENFENMFNLPMFWPAFWNTFKIAVLKILFGFPFPIIVALLLNEVRCLAFKKSVQTIIYLPYFLSWAVLGGIMLDIFSANGAVNSLLNAVGLPSVKWLENGTSFVSMLIMTDVWKNFGYNTIVFLAALTGVDKNLYEAAEVDGANRWKQTIHITLPAILPMIILMGVLNLGSILNAGFEQIFIMINNLVREDSEIIDTLVYDITFGSRQYGIATALGLFKSVISGAFIVTGWFLAHKFSDYRVF